MFQDCWNMVLLPYILSKQKCVEVILVIISLLFPRTRKNNLGVSVPLVSTVPATQVLTHNRRVNCSLLGHLWPVSGWIWRSDLVLITLTQGTVLTELVPRPHLWSSGTLSLCCSSRLRLTLLTEAPLLSSSSLPEPFTRVLITQASPPNLEYRIQSHITIPIQWPQLHITIQTFSTKLRLVYLPSQLPT